MKLFHYLICLLLWLVCQVGMAASSFQEEALTLHNKYRALHHAPKLVWDDQLADYAKQYASGCHFRHSHGPYGENLAVGYPSVSAGINAWYAEESHYSYLWAGFSYKTGHFTQVVWKSTRKLGCAYVYCGGRNGTPGYYLMCEYSPHGNVTNYGYFRANVLPS